MRIHDPHLECFAERARVGSFSETSKLGSSCPSLLLNVSHRFGFRTKVPSRICSRTRRFEAACLLVPAGVGALVRLSDLLLSALGYASVRGRFSPVGAGKVA